MNNIQKISGIYRLYLSDKNGKEWSYIGASKNIYNRFTIHKMMIRKMLKNKDNLLVESLRSYTVPAHGASYYKIAIFMIDNDKKITDLKMEILEEKEYQKIEDIEPTEIKYIEKYNSEWEGFNGPHAKQFKYIRLLTEAKYQYNKILFDQYLKLNEDKLKDQKLSINAFFSDPKKIEQVKKSLKKGQLKHFKIYQEKIATIENILKNEYSRQFKTIEKNLRTGTNPFPTIWFNWKNLDAYFEKNFEVYKNYCDQIIEKKIKEYN
ncbi:MAG: hypothetical protein HPPSJP_3340 [Candidatus Hepatoplasma scabrum]|nr:MAG: hypothetical protein HPPSJP_3340 [Candidatus Hepatoplasma sp.]